MGGILGVIEPFVRDSNERVALFTILRISGDAVIHGDADGEFERTKNIGERDPNAAAQSRGLRRIRLRKKQSEFVAADAKSGIGSTKRFAQSGGGGLEDLVAAGMTMLVVDFLEAVEIEDDQT